MGTIETCTWDTGTVYTGPVICGRPAKFVAVEGDGARRLVCGIHVRSARKLNYTVESNSKED